MPSSKVEAALADEIGRLTKAGTRKGIENVIRAVIPPADGRGPRFLLEGHGDKRFLRMNANGYLGMSFEPEAVRAEEAAVRSFGTGPGAVRFISGTWSPHIELEARLARFHARAAAMIFSSAYAAVMGILPPLISEQTAVLSDELNHNCIINAIALAKPAAKMIYGHLDMGGLERQLQGASRDCRRAIVVTDGIFSMRGDHAPLDMIMDLARRYDDDFEENVLVVVDDSHGVGAFGATGRGTEEHTASGPADILVATLGKAFGVNGGYIVANRTIIDYLRETSPFYIYSNPITPGEAAAAAQAIDILDSAHGRRLLSHLQAMTARFEDGLGQLGYETIPGDHPVVPLMVRDTERTTALVAHLHARGILATGLTYPVVPRGDEEIRFQISADHTAADLDEALDALAQFGR
ncbi:MAG: aminotransferase class I/II-fold pyridoxal phosphate-dependent enzyme [Methyloligellaceae bacterium]